MELACGAVVGGRYRLDALLGKGGMGEVWSATHSVTRRRVALKVLHGPSRPSPDLRQRFLREARAASAVEHPNVVTIHDVFELEDGTPLMVMDLLEGETLGARLARDQELSLADTARLMLPVVSAVGTAHERGIIHRDLKPDNIFILANASESSEVKVLDFGIAKLFGSDDELDLVTKTGAMLGTPCYMAPEQAAGEADIDHRADIWALGVILYESLSGGRPIEGDNLGQVLSRMLRDGIAPIEALVPDLPEDVVGLLGRMLSRERDARPKDLREVAEVLARHCSSEVPAFGEPGSRALEQMNARLEVAVERVGITPATSSASDAVSASEGGGSPSTRPWALALAGVAVVGLGLTAIIALQPSAPPAGSSSAATVTLSQAIVANPEPPVASAASANVTASARAIVEAPDAGRPAVRPTLTRPSAAASASAAPSPTPTTIAPPPTSAQSGGLVEDPPF